MKIHITAKHTLNHLVFACLSLLLLTSCDKFLDIEPKGVRLLETVEDYELWMNSEFLAASVPYELNLLADNMDMLNVHNPPRNTNDWVFTWQDQFSIDTKTPPVIWKDFYQAIYYYNTVLEGIETAIGGTDEQKRILKGEALLGRAFNYLYLVNLYGKQYDPATADVDLSVPFVISNDLNEPTPRRSTVQEMYNHILADLQAAMLLLPEDNALDRFRGTVAGVHSILARTYLYMGDYPKATSHAKLAIEHGPDEIEDYTAMTSVQQIAFLKRRADAIYARFSTQWVQEFPALEFLRSFDHTDRRLNFYYSNSFFSPTLGDYSFTQRGLTQYFPGGAFNGGRAYPNYGTTVAEMQLIRAEAAARANDLPAALEALHLVRKARIPASGYVRFESSNAETVLQRILLERTYELDFNGLRWLDMKRLNAEGRMPEVRRYDNEGNVVATLAPGSSKYTLQIPIQVEYFNPDWSRP